MHYELPLDTALGLEVSASIAMHVLVEVVHLESAELGCDFLDVVLFILGNLLYARCVPV